MRVRAPTRYRCAPKGRTTDGCSTDIRITVCLSSESRYVDVDIHQRALFYFWRLAPPLAGRIARIGGFNVAVILPAEATNPSVVLLRVLHLLTLRILKNQAV